jgi:ABC-type multidrug transport system ATPase subunit
MESLVSFQNVNVYYGHFQAVKNCSFEIYENEIFGLLGPNGAGKSSIIRIFLGEADFEGDIYLFGENLREISREKLNSDIGVVPQDPCFFKDFTVYENLVLAAKLYSLENIQETVESSISKFSLSDHRDKPVQLLSGGYKRLVSIAMSTIHNPKFIIMDEPTVGLDPDMRKKIWETIRNLKKGGKTIMMTTHYLEEASGLCDRVAIISGGVLLMCDRPDELVKKYGGNTFIEILVDKDPSPLLHALKEIPNVLEVKISNKKIEVECESEHSVRVIRDIVLIIGAPPYKIKPIWSNVKEPTLGDAFMKIVGSEIGI